MSVNVVGQGKTITSHHDMACVCRDPLKKAPEQIPGERPARRGDEQTQPQPGEAQASASLSEEEMAEMEWRAEQDQEHIAEAHE